jgi:1-deoxy-D-xylulose-5-phosphate synthase
VGSAVSQALRDADVDVPARDLGIPRRFLDHGSRVQVQADVGLTAQEVARRVVETVARIDGALESPAAEDKQAQRRPSDQR